MRFEISTDLTSPPLSNDQILKEYPLGGDEMCNNITFPQDQTAQVLAAITEVLLREGITQAVIEQVYDIVNLLYEHKTNEVRWM
jgi:hypothetical protein